MPRAYWKGYLRLSLVTCPVELYPATSQSEKTHFHQINIKTGNRLRQQMVDEETGKPVPKEQKGRGYELSKGRYVPIDDEELAAVQIESTRTIDIQGFVPKSDIDKRYLDKPYYIAPSDKAGAEAFVVIRDAMKDQDRVALAKIVMVNREHIIMIEPLGKGLLGTTLRFDYEVRSESDYFADIPSPRISRDMVELATHILEKKATKFDPSRFKDEYEIALKKLVQRKAKGHTIERPEPAERPSNVIDLMEALRASMKESKASRTKPKRRPAARKRKAA
ncbi:MAG TPA: Ku protein [Aestuariivirgaceae bacterium]|jgi:DNA end-binding protein Ku|nr:Ku protein [Aestuariivirgaceae bacterium]